MFPNRSLTIARPASLALAGTITALFCCLSVTPVAARAASTACPATTLVQPFLKYGDEGYYWLVPDGGFEGSSAGWSFAAGAKVLASGEPSAAGGSLGADSLSLPLGASAQSPFMCVEPSDRTFRFFLRSKGAAATVVASVVYETALGDVVVALKAQPSNSSWEPSEILHTGAALASAISGGVARLALRFTSTSGSARIDDVYLDPRMR